jgi:hypothetical protein
MDRCLVLRIMFKAVRRSSCRCPCPFRLDFVNQGFLTLLQALVLETALETPSTLPFFSRQAFSRSKIAPSRCHTSFSKFRADRNSPEFVFGCDFRRFSPVLSVAAALVVLLPDAGEVEVSASGEEESSADSCSVDDASGVRSLRRCGGIGRIISSVLGVFARGLGKMMPW